MFKLKSLFLTLSFLLIASVFLIGCNSEEASSVDEEKDGLTIITSFSILDDIVSNVIGDRGSVTYIIPIGEEPHEYEPIPSDYRKISEADVFYVNGFDLEGWLEKVVSNVSDTEIVTLSDGIVPIPIVGDDEADPHAWLDPLNVITYVENVTTDLIKRDPEGEEHYRANADAYIQELEELDAWIREQVAQVPEQQRVIVVSENAFKYFGEAYGFETEGIWELNSLEEGTPQQFARLADIIRERNIPAVFVETTVDKRYMETVSIEAGVSIAGEVYTDAVGMEGSGAETYIKMIKHNVNVFVEGLK